MEHETYRPKYEDILKEIEFIQDKKGVPKDYHAFVYWFIATLYDKPEDEIRASICDGTHDKGIDAVLINHDEKVVSIIQSKFERAGNAAQLNANEVKVFAIVRSYFDSRSAFTAATNKANPATQTLLDSAFLCISKGYTLEQIFITTHKSNPAVEPMVRDTLGLSIEQFRVFTYDNVLAIMADKSRDFLPMNKAYNLNYVGNDGVVIRRGQFNSWILTVKTNDVRDMAISYPGHLLFRKNVRDFLGDSTETNERMLQTLGNGTEARRFWYYNNGVTILCNSAKLDMEHQYIRLIDPEVINGCQTVTTIRNNKKDSDSQVLVRVIESQDHKFMDSVILYQNSSNRVLKRDLKSNDPLQVRLHHEFFKNGWFYEIKQGQEFEKIRKENKNIEAQCKFESIDNSEVAQVLAALRLHPATASGKGKEYFFGEVYEKIFTTDLSTVECLAPVLLKWLIRDSYSNAKFHTFERALIFKNPGTFFVLNSLFNSPFGDSDWQKKWVSFWQNTDYDSNEWLDFAGDAGEVIDDLFEVAYKGWREANKGRELDHNTYFKSGEEVDLMVKSHSKEISAVQKKFASVFSKHVFK